MIYNLLMRINFLTNKFFLFIINKLYNNNKNNSSYFKAQMSFQLVKLFSLREGIFSEASSLGDVYFILKFIEAFFLFWREREREN